MLFSLLNSAHLKVMMIKFNFLPGMLYLYLAMIAGEIGKLGS